MRDGNPVCVFSRGTAMTDHFRQAYDELKDFIAGHPEIEIGDSVIGIPESVRSEFYEKFNAARTAFVEERFPDLLRRANTLAENYLGVQSKVADLLAFEDPQTAAGVRRFLDNPTASLSRELFDPLFDLLRGRNDIDAFADSVTKRIEELFPALFRGGYEKWVELSLMSLMNADKAFRVDVRQLYPGERAKSAAQAPLHEVPRPFESGSFLFTQPRDAIFAVPDFIVHSARLNQCIGIRTDFKAGLYNALNPSHDRQWDPVNPQILRFLNSGLSLIYRSEQPESIALVSDVGAFCRPDVILWCVNPASLTQNEAFENALLYDSCLKPLKGIYVIACGPWPNRDSQLPDPESEKLELLQQAGGDSERIHVLIVGFDSANLLPILNDLMDIGNMATAT
jgi:hypothetical protein